MIIFISFQAPRFPVTMRRTIDDLVHQSGVASVSECVGVYGGEREGSYMIVCAPEAVRAIKGFARDMGQESVMVGCEGEYRIEFVAGPNAGRCLVSTSMRVDAYGAQRGDHTAYTDPVTGETRYLQVEFPWSTL